MKLMSHVVIVQTKVRDAEALAAACRRLNLAAPVQETVPMFSASVSGLAVRLPGWQFPVVVDLAAGAVHLDNYGGRWGEQREFDRFLQAYAVEKTLIEARRKGYAVSEQPLQDGSIQLEILTHA
jgi:hypothetical protein